MNDERVKQMINEGAYRKQVKGNISNITDLSQITKIDLASQM